MEGVTRRRLRRLAAGVQDWAVRQETEHLAAAHGLDAGELLAAARQAVAWCRRYRLQHGARWVGGQLDLEPELRAYAAAHGLDPDAAVAEARRLTTRLGR